MQNQRNSNSDIDPDHVADLLMEFFQLNNAIINNGSSNWTTEQRDRVRLVKSGTQKIALVYRNIMDFIAEKQIQSDLDSLLFERICGQLVNNGLLIKMHDTSMSNFTVGNYVSVDYNEDVALYGGYSMLVNGFYYIRQVFENSVLPVEVEDNQGKIGIGTAFYIGKGRFATARHVLEHMTKFRLLMDSKQLNINSVILDEVLDLAVIETNDEDATRKLPFIRLSVGNPLDKVMAMGYPSIDGCLNAPLITTSGEIAGIDKNYLAGESMLVISAKVRGGNSGGPVINVMGQAVGVVTNDNSNEHSSGEIFGLAIPACKILDLLDKPNSKRLTSIRIEDWHGYASE